MFLSVFIIASSALLASIGAWFVQKTQVQAGALHTVPPFIPLLTVTIAVSAFWSIQGSWRGAFGRLLHWQTRSYEAVRQFGQRVAGQIDLATLPDTVAAALVTELELERATVWLWHNEEGAFALVGQAGQWPGPLPDTLSVHEDPLN